MELEEFDISINRAEKKEDKIYYVILIHYKELKYEINRRFSEFEQLQCDLYHLGFSALPPLPEKKIMSYTNVDYINFRKKHLHIYLQNLFARPDIRCCSIFLNFFNFYEKINSPINVVKTKLINSICPQKFSLSDFYIHEKSNFIICVYEDRSNLSKLGKLWSIIEPDILGQIKIFSFNNDVSSTFIEKYKIQTFFKAKNIVYEETKNLAVISAEDGNIHIYRVNLETFQMNFLKNIACHNDSILYMMKFNDTVCTCGYDNAFRLFRISSNSKKERNDEQTKMKSTEIESTEKESDDYEADIKIISGGRCNKRLEDNKLTTCHLLEYNNIVLGTDNSLFFLYNLKNNPPIYLDTRRIKNGKIINCFTNTDKHLFIGHDNIIACYNYHYVTPKKEETLKNTHRTIINNSYNKNEKYNHEKNKINNTIYIDSDNEENKHKNKDENKDENKGNTKHIVVDNNICAQYVSPLISDNKVLCMCVHKTKKLLYAGYEDAIIIWSIVHGLIISAFHGHTCGVYCLKFLNNFDCLMSGGNGGNMKIWKSNLENYEFWKPKKRIIKGTKEENIKYNKYKEQNKNNIEINQDNFYFEENDDYSISDKGYNSNNSDAMSIDSLLNHNVKPTKCEIFDTSNYKKNIFSYNLNNNNNNNNNLNNNINNNISNNDDSFIYNNNNNDNIYTSASPPHQLPLFNPGREVQETSERVNANPTGVNYNSSSYKENDIYNINNLKNTNSYITDAQMEKHNYSTDLMQPQFGAPQDAYEFTFDDVQHVENVRMKNEKISGNLQDRIHETAIENNSHSGMNLHLMKNEYGENQMGPTKKTFDNIQNNFTQKEYSIDLKKKIVYASDEEDDDNNEDLIGAFN